MKLQNLHRESKKTRHQTLAHNFTKYWPIFKIQNSERILRIGQYLVKLWARVWCLVFFDSWCSGTVNAEICSCATTVTGKRVQKIGEYNHTKKLVG